VSVNYYAFGPDVTDPEGLHIGQYTATSRFLLRAHDDRGLTSLAAWMEFLRRPGVVIRAEHGLEKTVDEMEAAIRETADVRGWPKKPRITRPTPRPGYHRDAEGFEFYNGEFF
jgi:hypothetical protein